MYFLSKVNDAVLPLARLAGVGANDANRQAGYSPALFRYRRTSTAR
jgi:hypothetical protein